MVSAVANTSPTVTGASPRSIAGRHLVVRSCSQPRLAAYISAQLGASMATVATAAPRMPAAANPIRLTKSELGPGAACANRSEERRVGKEERALGAADD